MEAKVCLLIQEKSAVESDVSTGDNTIVRFTPPNQGDEVYLGSNTDAGWVGLTSQPAPDGTIVYSIYPKEVSDSTNWWPGFRDMVISIGIEVPIAVLFLSHPLGQAIAVAVCVEGGVFMLQDGHAFVQETTTHLIAIKQGLLAGLGTKYAIDVSSNGTATIQVIDGICSFH